MSTKEIGSKGEQIILEKYLTHGYELIVQNFEYRQAGVRGRQAEVDLILVKNKILVIVEVKTRNNHKFGSPLEAVTKYQATNLAKAYKKFISSKKFYMFRNYLVRVDIATVEKHKIEIIPNAITFDFISFN